MKRKNTPNLIIAYRTHRSSTTFLAIVVKVGVGAVKVEIMRPPQDRASSCPSHYKSPSAHSALKQQEQAAPSQDSHPTWTAVAQSQTWNAHVRPDVSSLERSIVPARSKPSSSNLRPHSTLLAA